MGDNQYSMLARRIRETIRKDAVGWAATSGVQLRPYQIQIALAIKDSIIHKKGLSFAVVLPRQSGKNEVQRHLFGWLLYRAAERGGTIVSVAPTFKPQTINAMERMRLTLDDNIATRGVWHSSAGFIFRFHKARLQFFSGEHTAKVVGATADLLLSVDEAQDIDASKFDKEFDPMTASTNATRVFWGTAWTSQTLLARQVRMAREEEQRDGVQRVFFYTAEDVAKIVPEYAVHLERVIKERGRDHPLVKTQYFNEEIDAQGGMFNAGRVALMQGDILNTKGTERSKEARLGSVYAFLIDVGGMDEARVGQERAQHAVPLQGNAGRDSTTLSIAEIDLSTLESLQAPTYRIVECYAWQGLNHLTVFGKLKALAETWKPQHIVIDATGVGEGLWAMLDKAFKSRVIPVKFTQQEKSEIGWHFLSIIETGRFRDQYQNPLLHLGELPRWGSRSIPERSGGKDGGGAVNPETVRIQYALCQSEILPGPAKTLRWGVPDGTRDPDGELVHDDFVLADSLVAKLDELEWHIHFETFIIQAKDPLDEMSRFRRSTPDF